MGTAKALLAKPVVPVFCFLSGVVYDTFTLTRIDRLQDNLILLVYLLLLGVLIVLTGRLNVDLSLDQERAAAAAPLTRWALRVKPIGLLSA